MSSLNLSEWALQHRSLVWYMMLVFVLAGIFSYQKLGREEDPSFTIKTMVVQAKWPGATIDDTAQQVTDRIEKKLQETPHLDYLRSYTRPGESTIFVNLLESTAPHDVPTTWRRVRDEVDDTSGRKLLVIMEDRNKELHPAIDILNEAGHKLAGQPAVGDEPAAAEVE